MTWLFRMGMKQKRNILGQYTLSKDIWVEHGWTKFQLECLLLQDMPYFLSITSNLCSQPFCPVLKEWSNDSSVQFTSEAQSCLTLHDPMACSMPGFPVHHQFRESTQTHVHWVGDAIQPSHPLSSPSPPAFNLSHHQVFFQWVSYSRRVAKILEFHL